MVSSVRAAGLSVLALGLASRQAMAVDVDDCVALLNGVGDGGETSFTLTSDMACSGDSITVASGSDITVVGGGNTLSIGAGFSGESLFDNQGTLTLNNVVIEQDTSGLTTGVRAISNEGALTVSNCAITGLNLNSGTMLTKGGAIYSDSAGDVVISDSQLTSNFATQKGGAICALGTGPLTIQGSTFRNNEVGLGAEEAGAGGDVYAAEDVTLTLKSSNFTESVAEYGGAAVECCGATIEDCLFSGTESFFDTEHFGALLVGRPDMGGCPNKLDMKRTNFTGCVVSFETGRGGALAVFDTSADIEDCVFEGSQGTAVLFESSSATGANQLVLSSAHFYQNSLPSQEFEVSDAALGAGLVVKNTAVSGDTVTMGKFKNVYCFGNEPYECELVYDSSDALEDGEFKCQTCNEGGERTFPDTENDLGSSANVNGDSDDSGSSEYSEGVFVGLTVALGLTLVVIGALAVWIFRLLKNAVDAGPSEGVGATPQRASS